MAEFVKVARKSEVPAQAGKYVQAEGKEIALFNVDGKIYAIHHICPHQGGPLAEGGVEEGTVMCPWHGWTFNVKTGECTFDPSIKQETYKVREEGEDIFVEV